MPDDVSAILETNDLAKLKAKFDADQMNAALEGSLPKSYPQSTKYVEAIADSFTIPASSIDRDDRERILIALLAARGERLNLAIHVYYALGVEVTVNEILHILLLTGVYTGIPAFANAMETVGDAFRLFKTISATEPEPPQVLAALMEAFDLPPDTPL